MADRRSVPLFLARVQCKPCSHDGRLYAKTTTAQEYPDARWVIRARVMARQDAIRNCRSASFDETLKAPYLVWVMGVTAVVIVASLVWILNIAFGFWRGFHDLLDGKRGQAAIGIICVIGVNTVLGWMTYMAISTSHDL